MIVRINSKETIEASEALLNVIGIYIYEGAEHLRMKGNEELADRAQKIAQEISWALDKAGYFPNVPWNAETKPHLIKSKMAEYKTEKENENP